MERYLHSVIEPVLEAVSPRAVADLDDGSGRVALALASTCRDRGVRLTVVHPQPHFDVDELHQRGQGVVSVQRVPTLRAAHELSGEVVLLHADPNWYTVRSVLQVLDERDDAPLPVVLVHGVRWPFGRRDGYAQIDDIPEEARQPASREGIQPGRGALDPEGLDTGLWNAASDFGARNGVRTAIDDFAQDTRRRVRIVDLPGMGGLAVVADEAVIAANARLAELLDHLGSAEFLEQHSRQLDIEVAHLQAALQAADRRAQALSAAHGETADRLAVAEREAEAAAQAQVVDRERLQAETAAVRERADTLAEELRGARQAHATAQGRVREADDALSAARVERDRLVASVAAAERDRAVAQARLAAVERSSATIERELRDARDRLDERLAANEQERLALRVDLARRDGELEQLRAERQVLQARVDQDAQRVADANVDIEQLRRDLDGAAADRQTAQRRLQAVQRELEGREVELDAMRSQERLMATRASELDGRVSRLEAERTRLEGERTQVRELVERARDSRSWRMGHRMTIWMRRLTFRKPQSADGSLDRAVQMLTDTASAPAPPELPPARSDLSAVLQGGDKPKIRHD